MSQHDMSIANQGFPAFRSDLNDALQALVSQNSGATAPSTTFANMLWYDTANNILKMRNEDNDAWISIATLDQTTDTLTAIAGKTLPTGVIVGESDTQTLTNKTIGGSQLVDASVTSAKLDTNAQYMGFKNRIINGAMMIDQRGGTISVSTGTATYGIDRWAAQGTSSAGIFSFRQTANAPTGFNQSLYVTVGTADASLASGDLYAIQQRIEGYNIADLGWGTANAKTVTLSFWVRSNLTGTFGGSVTNSAFNRSYPFSYTISSADTWEQKSITIAGDTTGTWLSDNGIGMRVYWGLGIGSNYNGTVNTWAGAGYISVTGATNVMASTSNNFYITGVQLEKGSTATSFDYRPYGTELALCQRYYVKYSTGFFSGYCESSSVVGILSVAVPMRAYPSFANGTASGVGTVFGTLFDITGTGTTPFGDTSPRQNFAIEFPASVSGKTWQTMFVRIPNVQLNAEL